VHCTTNHKLSVDHSATVALALVSFGRPELPQCHTITSCLAHLSRIASLARHGSSILVYRSVHTRVHFATHCHKHRPSCSSSAAVSDGCLPVAAPKKPFATCLQSTSGQEWATCLANSVESQKAFTSPLADLAIVAFVHLPSLLARPKPTSEAAHAILFHSGCLPSVLFARAFNSSNPALHRRPTAHSFTRH
jgi:hypothetical protein